MSAAKRRELARDRKAFVRLQLRILRKADLHGPYGQEYLDESTQRRLANIESERRRLANGR
jgi:hypothetical protein